MSAHLPCGGVPFSLQHLADGLAQFAQFVRCRADETWLAMIEDEAWPSSAGLHVMGKVGDDRAVHL